MITFKSKGERVVHSGKCLGKLIEQTATMVYSYASSVDLVV